MPSTVLNIASETFAPWRDVTVPLPADFRLESREALSVPELRVRIFGDVDAPLVVVLGGISAGRKVCDTAEEGGWWGDVAGPGLALNTDTHAVLGFDFLPNQGETATTISVNDQARALAAALDVLDLDEVHTFAGSSFGGMIGLAFASLFPARIENLCVISAAHRAHPMTTALRGVQRRIIAFARDHGDAESGVALARELAMTTYRSVEEFGKRFGDGAFPAQSGGNYDVCDYLQSRGRAYAEVMDPQRYITLSDSLDRHYVDPNTIHVRTLLVAAEGDRLVPESDMEALARALTPPVTLAHIPTKFGHDAFLLEGKAVSKLITTFLQGEPK